LWLKLSYLHSILLKLFGKVLKIANHVTIGVYANGDHVVNIVRPEHLEGHIEYNKVMRFGRALFVDGLCMNKGYLSKDAVESWANCISTMRIDSTIPSKEYR